MNNCTSYTIPLLAGWPPKAIDQQKSPDIMAKKSKGKLHLPIKKLKSIRVEPSRALFGSVAHKRYNRTYYKRDILLDLNCWFSRKREEIAL